MRRISTGIEQLLTTDAVADTILSYATALARAHTADSVTIPIVRDDGRIDEARLLLGPASQLTIVPAADTEMDLPGASAVADDLRSRIARLEPQPIEADGSLDLALESAFPNFDDFE